MLRQLLEKHEAEVKAREGKMEKEGKGSEEETRYVCVSVFMYALRVFLSVHPLFLLDFLAFVHSGSPQSPLQPSLPPPSLPPSLLLSLPP